MDEEEKKDREKPAERRTIDVCAPCVHPTDTQLQSSANSLLSQTFPLWQQVLKGKSIRN